MYCLLCGGLEEASSKRGELVSLAVCQGLSAFVPILCFLSPLVDFRSPLLSLRWVLPSCLHTLVLDPFLQEALHPSTDSCHETMVCEPSVY